MLKGLNIYQLLWIWKKLSKMQYPTLYFIFPKYRRVLQPRINKHSIFLIKIISLAVAVSEFCIVALFLQEVSVNLILKFTPI